MAVHFPLDINEWLFTIEYHAPEVNHDCRKFRLPAARPKGSRRTRRRSYSRCGPRRGAGAWRGGSNGLLHGPQLPHKTNKKEPRAALALGILSRAARNH